MKYQGIQKSALILDAISPLALLEGEMVPRESKEKREMFSKKGKLLFIKVKGIEMERNWTYFCGREGRCWGLFQFPHKYFSYRRTNMKKTRKWAKVFYFFLILSFIVVNISGGPGDKKSKGSKTPMHAIAWLGDCGVQFDSPLFSGDTREDPSCGGAMVPSNNRNFWTDMGVLCIDALTLVGEDGEPGGGDDIDIGVIGFTTYRNKRTGEVEEIKIDLISLPSYEGFQTDKIKAWDMPTPNGFTIYVCQDEIAVKRRQKGRPIWVGYISVGVIDYVPKQIE